MSPRTVRAVSALHGQALGAGFQSWGLRTLTGVPLDPFLSLDLFEMSQPTFPPHPHAGFSAVTVMFEDSPGGFVNRDSLGDRSRIRPGGLHWTQAGRGMMHEEVPEVPGVRCYGVQMFVNLSRAHELAPPRTFHLEPHEVPVLEGKGARVRVLAGALGDVRSPLVDLLTPILLLDVQLQPGASTEVAVPGELTAVGLVARGSGASAGAALTARQGVGWGQDGQRVALTAGAEGLHVLLAAGRAIGEPVVFAGPFALSSRDRVEEAAARFRRGEMGRL